MEATGTVEQRSNDILFTVRPSSGPVSLDKVRAALDVFLTRPIRLYRLLPKRASAISRWIVYERISSICRASSASQRRPLPPKAPRSKRRGIRLTSAERFTAKA